MNAIIQTPGCSHAELDWTVVEIARKDGPRSINPNGRNARFLRSFFGLQVPRGLSNDRAEALRRFSVRAWYWDRIRLSDLRPLTDAGYSIAQVDQILAYVSRFRGFTPWLHKAAA